MDYPKTSLPMYHIPNNGSLEYVNTNSLQYINTTNSLQYINTTNSLEPLILFWVPVSTFMGPNMLVSSSNCPVKCRYTEDDSLLDNATAIIFLLVGFADGHSFPPKKPGQYFVAMSMESVEYYVHMKNKEFMGKFDYKMTYQLNSDFPMLYISSKANYSTLPLSIAEKYNDTLISIFISNAGPRNQRNSYTKQLMKLLPCHSYGKFEHNKDMSPYESKRDVMRKYKFHLAFENSDTKDYVTEKLFQALQVGTVPIYMGAPNIDDFSPSNHSVIKVSDFGSPEELADYIQMLNQNNEKYEEYLTWKRGNFAEGFNKLRKIVKYEAKCRLCMKLHGLPVSTWANP